MDQKVAQIRSETAYDALQDATELVLRLFVGSRSTAQLAAETRDEPARVEAALGRLARAGLVRQDGDRWEVLAQLVHQTRQEGMVTFLTRYFLPSVTKGAREPGHGFWVQLDLDLAPEEQEALRGGEVQRLVEELNSISLRPATPQRACTAVVIGTSDVPRDGEEAERMVETVRRCARQRATPGAAGRAVLTQFDALFGTEAIPEAEQKVRNLADRLGSRRTAEGQRPGYTVLLGFVVRERPRAIGGEDEA